MDRMNAEFRYIKPEWDTEDDGVISVLEPSKEREFEENSILSNVQSGSNAYRCGFVDLEKKVLADLMRHRYEYEKSLHAQAADLYWGRTLKPAFMSSAPKHVSDGEKITALAVYLLAVISARENENDLDVVDEVFMLYFRFDGLESEMEDDCWNYSPDKEEVDCNETCSVDEMDASWKDMLSSFRCAGDEKSLGGEDEDFPGHLKADDISAFKCLPRGSTRPHEGWIDGRHYVLKCGSYSALSSDEHVHNEYVADELLRAAGCLVPASREYRADIGHGKVETIRLSEYVENGRTLADAYSQGTACQREKLVRQVIATYPVISFVDGTDTYKHAILDNVLVDPDYNLWFIDNGASFDFRARGLRKNWFWARTDILDPSHGYYAIRTFADAALGRILQGVTDEALREAAKCYDFTLLVGKLPVDYRQQTLVEYARQLDAWARGMDVDSTSGIETAKGAEMTSEDCAWLETVSLQIAKAVRRIDIFIDSGKSAKTAGSRTMANYADALDLSRLQRLAPQDPSGRVGRLLSVCDDIANSEAAGFTVPVLAGRWQPTVASQQRVGKMGNVDFAEYAFSREVFEKAGGVIASTASPRATSAANGGTIDVICGRVEDVVADAVVNAANERLAAGSGICGAIFRKAGYAPLQAACNKVAPCPTGEARITPAFGIKNAKWIVHAVGPRWFGGGKGEPALLANCYRNLLKTAVDNGCTSVAIPSISTGVFGYPLDAAIEIAVREVKAFVAAHPGFKVVFVVWDGDADGGKSTKEKYLKAMAVAT